MFVAGTDERTARIKAMLEAGRSHAQIRDELGVSLSVISRTALRLGFRARLGPPVRYDWEAIRRFYEAGHTPRECRERFGSSPGAWDQAVSRGDIVPRPGRAPARHRHDTRRAVERLLAEGKSQAEIARILALSKGTVAFHVRNLGIPADGRFRRRYDWEAVQRAHDAGLSASECCRRFGFTMATWTQAIQRGAIVPRPRELPLDQLFASGVKRGRNNLKRRLIQAGLKENRCEICGITEWLGKPLSMQLHHRNGDGRDNRLENIQLLCANCHSRTTTYGGRNGHRRPGRGRPRGA